MDDVSLYKALDPLALVALGVTVVVNLRGFTAFVTQIRNRTPKDNFYEDEDGKSTPESMAAFSNAWPKFNTIALSLLGLAISAWTLITGKNDELCADWYLTIVWVSL